MPAARALQRPTATTTCPSRCGPSARPPRRRAGRGRRRGRRPRRRSARRHRGREHERAGPRRTVTAAAAVAAGDGVAERAGAAGARREPTAAAGPSRRAGPARRSGGATRVAREHRRRRAVGDGAVSRRRATTRSAYCTTRSRRCSARTTVTPRSWTSRVTAASTSSAAVGSSADVGSSSTRTGGCAREHRADGDALLLAAREVGNARCRRSARPSRSSVSSTRLRITAGGTAELLHAVRELFLDGVGDEPGERVLPDDADHVGELARRASRRVRGRRPRPGRERPAGEMRDEPVDGPSSVDLPTPVAPTTRHSSPSSMCRFTLAEHRSVRRRRR